MEQANLDWVQALIDLMHNSMDIGAVVYPVIMGFGLIRIIIENV